VLAPRQRDVEYDADHYDGRWVIRTNDGAKNFKLVTAPTDATSRAQWKDWIAHDDAVFIEGFELFDSYTAIAERSEGLERIRLLFKDGRSDYVKADEPAYSMGLGDNTEADTPWLRYIYTSMTTPTTVFELNTATGERRQLKVQPVIGYDASKYETDRVWITARDGVKVPVSLVYRKGYKKDGKGALFQYAYGSYGMSMDPYFNQTAVSLLDRGVVYAIAHIRGGQEMGRDWYENGKLLHKQNTFNDFIDVTRGLVAQGWAAKDRVAASGGSAGGLRRGHHHARPDHSADHQRVRRVGQPGAEAVLRLHAVLLALRQREEAGLSGAVRGHRPVGFAGAVLGTGQVGGQAA